MISDADPKLSTEQIEQFINSIPKQGDISGILAAASDGLAGFGAQFIMFMPLPRIDGTDDRSVLPLFSPQSDPEAARMIRNIYLARNQPILELVLLKGRARWFSDLRKEPSLQAPHIAVRFDWIEHKFGDALAVPLYGPHRHVGYCVITFADTDLSRSDTFMTQVEWLCSYVYHQYCVALNALEIRPHLSIREIEVIRHLASGKTNPEIALAMNIAVNTVNTHIKRIFHKLGTTNRVTAALRAYALELIN